MLSTQEKAKRYVIYARKSTDEKGKQEKSIEDQVSYCKELAERDQLNVISVIEEKKSAKLSGQRLKFNQLMKDIVDKRVDGIIAWHPDRLARNMGDGGRIIEMVDAELIWDLRFCTQQFSRDANGKMLLGLAFVLSKQYSDKLSDDVRRAQTKRHEVGLAIGRTKHGYDIGDDGYYKKGEFWGLIRDAWRKRLTGESETQIAEWVNDQGYCRQIKNRKKQKARQIMTAQKLNKIFKDPLYYGLSIMRDVEVHLDELYDFPVMITKEEYWRVQRVSPRGGRYIKRDHYLREKIFDAEIEGLEYKPQVIKGKAKKYLRYIVDPKHKKRLSEEDQKKVKGIKAKDILNALDDLFEKINPKFTKENYRKAVASARKYTDQQYQNREDERRRLRGMRTKAKHELDDIKENFLLESKNYDQDDKKAYHKKRNGLEKEISTYSTRLSEMEQGEIDCIPSFEKFLNTIKTLSKQYHSFAGEQKLEIAEMLILNTLVSNGKVVKISLIEPFDKLFLSDGWKHQTNSETIAALQKALVSLKNFIQENDFGKSVERMTLAFS